MWQTSSSLSLPDQRQTWPMSPPKQIFSSKLLVLSEKRENKSTPTVSLSIFIEPPSVEDLKLSLQKRGADDNERIVKRLGRLDTELAYKSNFDYHVINDDLDQAVKEIMNIINNKNKGVLYGSWTTIY